MGSTPGRRCSKCGVAKPTEEFSANRRRLDGFDWHCRACIRERIRLKRLRHLANGAWAQGEYDLVVTVELPDAETANALALAAMSPGHARAYRTTPLFTNAETMRAMSRAGEVSYRAPGQPAST